MTIFNNIVKDENDFTQLLCNMMQFKEVREAFLSLIDINEEKQKNINFEHFETEYSLGDNGRVDLAILTDTIITFVEVKINDAPLQDNQPATSDKENWKGYLESLNNDYQEFEQILVFLTKENYSHLDEWKNRTKIWKKKHKNSGIELKEISWEKLCTKLDEKYQQNQEKFGEIGVYSDFRKLLKDWFEVEPIILNKEILDKMKNKNLAQVIESILTIIDQIKEQLVKISLRKITKKLSIQEYGGSVYRDASEIIFFGRWLKHWKNTGNPICLGIDKVHISEDKFRKAINESSFFELDIVDDKYEKEFDNWLTASLKLETPENLDTLTIQPDEIAQEIDNIICELEK